MGRIVATLATLLILVLGAAFVVPALVDWNQYRPLIERTASGILGRKVSILGDIDIVLLPEPHLRASNIAAGNPVRDGAALTAESVDLNLSLQALVSGRIEAGSVRLVRPAVTLDFARPFAAEDPDEDAQPSLLTAGANNIEIDRGRLAVFSKGNGTSEALTLTKISGTVTSGAPGGGYRFIGRFVLNGRQYESKFTAGPAPGSSVRVTGTGLDPASKITLQADGQIGSSGDPAFEGTLSVVLPAQAGGNRIPVETQIKAAAKLGLANAQFGDLEITADPQNRPQVLLGSASLDFNAKAAALSLEARAIDIDGLLAANPATGIPVSGGAPADWSGLYAAADRVLWFDPDFSVRLSFEATQLLLRGEPVENVKIRGTRSPERWVLEQVLARLPGETDLRLAGTISNSREGHQLNAASSIEGKYLSRLGRWIASSGMDAAAISTGMFAAQGAVMLSEEAASFEGVNGSLDGTHFTGSVRLDKAPMRKLTVSLSGDNFDVSAFGGEDSLARQLPKLASLFNLREAGFDSVEADLSAAGLRTGTANLRNVAAHIKAGPSSLAISRLSAETDAGLSLQGSGTLPLESVNGGRFEGRLEAKSPQAVLQLAELAGPEAGGFLGRRARSLAPAALSVSYGSGQGGETAAQLSGVLGDAHADGRVQIAGSWQDLNSARLSAQLSLSSNDGNALLALALPGADLVPGASLAPGTLSFKLDGAAGQIQTNAALSAPALQAQIDGVTSFQGAVPVFKGTATASAQAPGQFLAAPLLALLGGEDRASFRVTANAELAPAYMSLSSLNAESPNNAVTGRLLLDMRKEGIRVDATLKAAQYSIPTLMDYFLAGTAADTTALQLPVTAGAPAPLPDLWSGRPFAKPALEGSSGTIVLEATAMKLSDAITVSGAQLRAKLANGSLDVEELKGKTLNGDLEASLSLTSKGTAVSAECELNLSGADLSLLPTAGVRPMISGRAWISLSAAGEGLSPRGVIAVLRGRGTMKLSEGQLAKLSPSGVQKSAEDLLAGQTPLSEDTIAKKLQDAIQTSDFSFRRLRFPLLIQDGMLEVPRASFRGRDSTVRLEAYLDLSKMQADSTWLMGSGSDRRAKWPPVKVSISGPLRELGSRPRTLASEDFVRAIMVRKMEGDLSTLEGLNKPRSAAPAPWTTTQEPPAKQGKTRKKEDQLPAQAPPRAQAASPTPFEKRMRDALDNAQGAPAPR